MKQQEIYGEPDEKIVVNFSNLKEDNIKTFERIYEVKNFQGCKDYGTSDVLQKNDSTK